MSIQRKTFVIERLPEGGFVIAPIGNGSQLPVFASLDVEDALQFIWDQFELTEGDTLQ